LQCTSEILKGKSDIYLGCVYEKMSNYSLDRLLPLGIESGFMEFFSVREVE
jgi:hypothetical protein